MRFIFAIFITLVTGLSANADPSAARQAADRRAHPELADTCAVLKMRDCRPSQAATNLLTIIDSKVALCKSVADSPQCKQISDKAVDKSKFLNCDPEFICKFSGQTMQDANLQDCLIKGLGLEIPGKGLLQAIAQAKSCDENQNDEKSKIVDAFNASIHQQIAEVQKQIDEKLARHPGRETTSIWDLDFGGTDAAIKKLNAAIIGDDLKKSMLSGRGAPCSEISGMLKIRRESFDGMLSKLVAGGVIRLPVEPFPIVKAIKDLGLSLECYSPKAKGELICEAGVMVAATLLSGGMSTVAKAAALQRLEALGATRPALAKVFGVLKESTAAELANPTSLSARASVDPARAPTAGNTTRLQSPVATSAREAQATAEQARASLSSNGALPAPWLKTLATADSKEAASQLLPTIASYGGSIESLQAKALSTAGLSEVERANLKRTFDAAVGRTTSIRSRYELLANVAKEDQGKLVPMIDSLEQKGVSQSRIKAELEKAQSICPIN